MILLHRLDALSSDKKPVSVDTIGGAGEQCAVVLAVFDEKIIDFIGLDYCYPVHLISKNLRHYCQCECIAYFHLIKIGEKTGTGKSSVARYNAVCGLSAYRKTGSREMSRSDLENVLIYSVIHRKLYSYLVDINVSHNACTRDIKSTVISRNKLRMIENTIGCGYLLIELPCLFDGRFTLLLTQILYDIVSF